MITPVALTVVNWDDYLKTCRTLLNRSVTDTLDRQHRPIRTLPGFLSTLADGASLGSSNDSFLSRHISASFIVDVSDTYIPENCQLACTTLQGRRGAMILSGNLLQWKEAIVNFCQERTPELIRNVFNEIQVAFENAGLASLWSEYNKTQRSNYFLLTKA